MASNAIAAVNVLNFIPEAWSLKVKADVEKNLVCVGLVDRGYQEQLKFGQKLNVPNLADLGAATAVAYTSDLTLIDLIQNTDQIIINQHYYQAVGEGIGDVDMDRPDYLEAALSKCAYAVAKQMDTSVNELFNAFSQAVGTEGSALTADVLLNAYEYLNLADAPHEGRAWIFDPESITDLLQIDLFVHASYTDDMPWKNGFQGRTIMGAPVYMSTNLEAINTSYHGAAYLHKEAIALIQQTAPTVFRFYWDEKFTWTTGVRALWGLKEMRDTFGVWIRTRS